WRFLPVVVAAVGMANWRIDQFLHINVVQRGQLYRDIISAYRVEMAAAEWANTAVAAEQMMTGKRTKLVVTQGIFAGKQPEITGPYDGIPVARFGADGTIAFVGAGSEIDIGLKAHGTAMAAAEAGFFHCSLL